MCGWSVSLRNPISHLSAFISEALPFGTLFTAAPSPVTRCVAAQTDPNAPIPSLPLSSYTSVSLSSELCSFTKLPRRKPPAPATFRSASSAPSSACSKAGAPRDEPKARAPRAGRKAGGGPLESPRSAKCASATHPCPATRARQALATQTAPNSRSRAPSSRERTWMRQEASAPRATLRHAAIAAGAGAWGHSRGPLMVCRSPP
mmetsp:Transcript_90045/g.291405  ORF Transcript_90045/g.291405 Transcript_90045/m.291405 type:complete len:204 (-) Transcript_90045:13-624(-)